MKNILGATLIAALGSMSATSWAQAQETLIVDTVFQLKTADPARSFEPTAALWLHAVYENLVTFTDGDTTTVKPGLADAPVVSDDAKTFTFTLREGATFSDGSPVTIEDVVFSLNRAINVKGNAAYILAGLTIKAGSEPNTVVVTTENPDPALPARLTYPAFAIVNADVAQENGAAANAEAAQTDTADVYLATASLGSGPYILSKFDMASEVVLTRNDNYWGDPAAFDQIVIRNTANAAQQMNIMRNVSQIAIDLRPDQVSSLGDGANVISQPGSDMGWLFLNANPEISATSSNPKIWEAVRYGLDYEGIRSIAGESAGRPGGIIPSIILGSLPTQDAPVRDVERAKAAVAASGIENPTLDMAYASDIAKHGISFGDIGAKVQADLAEIGITVNLVPQPVTTNLDAYRAGQLQFSVQWWGSSFPDPVGYLPFTPGLLVGTRAGWPAGSDPTVEEISARAAVVVDAAERAAVYEEFQKALNASSPFIPLFQPPTTLVSATAVDNVTYNPTWTVDLTEVVPAAE
ncbi:ABC transporter substrate-binding protein [Devosia sp. 1566]|uniref:ABC transporter substrate-binding protein n=1 Tax=Devosia sp. 1566 TaxID=2499144 RepID=UPI000FD7430B|nr:ABC transporter substrate-binding protein [Devosia sp. 1566]